MKSKFSLLLLAFIFCAFSGCLKKGEDDPLISLRTRKARIVGNWYMVSGKRTTIEGQKTEEITYTKDSFTANVTDPPLPSLPFTGHASFTINFESNGKMEELKSLYITAVTEPYLGTWNFTGGIGEVKNKGQLVLHYDDFIGNVAIIYNIRELRNKKLVLFRQYGNEKIRYVTEEFTFQQN